MMVEGNEGRERADVPAAAWLAVIFLAGCGTMILELTAPRLMQPWFGSSVFVWTHVIGVILVALALGYELGGRLSPRPGLARRVGSLLAGAAALAVAAPFTFGWIAGALLPDPGTLGAMQSARSQLELASFVATLLIFAPPVLLLATVSPQVIRALVDGGFAPGRASGRVFMTGTIGSLVGTFLPTYVLVPSFGSRTSLVVAGTILLLPALFLLLRGRGRALALLSLAVAPALAPVFAKRALRAALPGEELIAEIESRYQYLRVVDAPALGEGVEDRRERLLRINEGLVHDFHSVATEGIATTGGKYYDTFALLPSLFPADRELSVLVLGSGAGTMARVFDAVWGSRIARWVNVELDPEVARLEPQFSYRAPPHHRTDVLDGRVWLRLTTARFDLILLDAYDRQIDIPFHMATREFFADVRAHLTDDGVAALNVSGTDRDHALVRSLVATVRAGGFERPMMTPVRYWANLMMWMRRDGSAPSWPAHVPEDLRATLRHAKRYTDAMAAAPTGLVLTDAYAPVEHLTDLWLKGRP